MMFVAREGLRVLGVIEFAVLVLSMMECSTTSIVDGVEVRVDIWHKILDAIGSVLAVPILGFVWLDTRVCDDALITIALASTTAMFVGNCLTKIAATLTKRSSDVDIESPAEGASTRSGHNSEEMGLGWFRSHPSQDEAAQMSPIGTIVAKMAILLAVFFLVVLVVGLLAIFALFCLYAVTYVKVAIPSAYSTSCDVHGRMSPVLMVGIPSAVCASMLLSGGMSLVSRYCKRRIGTWCQGNHQPQLRTSFGFASDAVLVLPRVFAFVFVNVLAVGVARIWRGADINEYEFIALTAALLIRA
jgi:hypothetical protein